MRTLTVLLLGCCFVGFTACSDDDDPVDPQPQEFIASDADFAGYRSWAQPIEPQQGKDPAGLLGGAHAENDSASSRHIFINDNNVTRDGNGNFPVGTRLAKEMRMADGTVAMVTAMVKRGGEFNPTNRNWEWLILDTDGKILQRGADLFDNACNGCHAKAFNEDYVFTK